MLLQRYFERVGYDGNTRPDLDVLTALQTSHVRTVPFENLDVQLGIPVTNDVEAAYEKVVVNGRGGWCYEQNGLFGWALSEVGFDVTRIACSVMRQDRGDVSYANHLCLLVNIQESDSKYVVDVGFGGSMFKPIALGESVHNQPPFRIGLKKLEDGYWRFWEDIGTGAFGFDFCAEPADESALQDKCAFLQSDPSSGFVLNLVAQLRLPEQHLALRGRVFSTATPGGIQSSIIDSADDLVSTLANHFGLDLPEVADLWPKIAARHEELLREKALTDTYGIRARTNKQSRSFQRT
jgi:N-hydroxyarylamine O-acetyltransferase